MDPRADAQSDTWKAPLSSTWPFRASTTPVDVDGIGIGIWLLGYWVIMVLWYVIVLVC
jgi:hypothetical protein